MISIEIVASFFFLMKFDFYYLLIALAVWRLTNMFIHEPGPYEVFHRFRYVVGVRHDERNQAISTNELSKIFVCHWCLSFWIAMIVVGGLMIQPNFTFTFCLPFALSAVSILINESMIRWGNG